MRFDFCTLTLCVLALAATSGHASESANIPALVMTSPNSAFANYEDKCSNGGNLDNVNREKFLKLMLADQKSKLSQLKVALLNEIKQSGDEPRGEGVRIGEWNQTFHDRSGCGTNTNSYSAFVVTVTGGNANHTVVKSLVTIDDDDNAGKRTLKIRDIRPIKLRNDN
ncbi:MAG: hypothetical protein RMZ42_22815 [Nostoc sp. DedQUE05]|uniref:hypothetical protein n=1 Tax=Nostoc sp. DedQUE05 TaxID=3075391 RepID=UPI002AD441E2|nr:hypothetical protein [Nostoc sp. DedQUE05]MDZ8094743.1 hypothetical protein [Nostoc sp. DedQUE05]